MKTKSRQKLKSWMQRKISFRFHMSLIMLSTVILGIISNFIMLNTIGVNHPALRYPLTVIFSYLWFLFLIRTYIRNILLSPTGGSALDFVDFSYNTSATSTGDGVSWEGSGGQFSGGGASGDWVSSEVVGEVAKKTTSEVIGVGVDGLADDEGGFVLLLVIGALAAILFGSGAYFIWHSPEILSECLIQVILVSGMRKRMKKFTEAEWINHMVKTTRWPFLTVLVFSLILGLTLRAICPEANNFNDYRTNCWKGY